jgi:hypothetical protein
MSKIEELKLMIIELRREIAELKANPPAQYHFHYPQQLPSPPVWPQPYQPPIYQPWMVWSGVGVDGQPGFSGGTQQ